jgi:two-component system, OmpR family, sensor histidine kinase ChvG
MRLAGQLLAVSAVTLLLPWAGCQYAREIETALRDGEEQALVSTARLLGAALAPAAAEFAADPERWSAARGRSADIYAHALGQAPTLDGFVEDWGLDRATMERFGGMALLAARRGAFVHLFVTSADDAMPAALEVRGRQASLEFALEAPGPVTASARGITPDPRARGYWQPTSRGWQLEARIPETLLQGRLGVRLRSQAGTIIASTYTDAPGWITGPDRAAQAALEALAPPGQRAYLADRGGFILAAHGPRRGVRAGAPESALEPLYRRMLGRRLEADPPPAARPGQLSGRHLELAVLGTVDARRYAVPGGGLLAAAAPVGTPGALAAVVVVERDTAEILSLTSAPTRRLLGLSLFASLGAAAVLLGFGAVLSLRIRRLRDAAAGAVGLRGEVRGPMPGARADDELGDLARNFDGLLGRVREHNLYLQSLGGRLAHELRTPLAVVRSSLDNLEAESGTSGPWLGRAREGVDRMSGLVNALSAARRIERAIGAAEREHFDLAAQLEDMTAAYGALHPERRFELRRPPQPCLLEGTPDLVAQALDKLVENAVDFAPPDAPIRLNLQEAGDCWRLAVANTGSRLPPGPAERLFDSLVSHREDDSGSHLGLGLFIVRLVAEHHGGRATARNLPDEPGVEFAMELRRIDATLVQR